MRAVTSEVISRFGDEIKRSGSTLSLDAAAEVRGRWDRSRLDQVVKNIISNALKYGRGKPIEVSVGTRGERARLVVRDRGRNNSVLKDSFWDTRSGPNHPQWKILSDWLDKEYPDHRDPLRYWDDCEDNRRGV